MTSPTTVSSPAPTALSPLKKKTIVGNNVSDHTNMTTPLSEETDPTHTAMSGTTPAVVTPTKPETTSGAQAQIEEDLSSRTLSTTSEVDLILGDFVAEGGFCSIYELTGIKNLDNGEWILEPPSSTPKKHHKRGGTGAFGSLGHLALAGMSTRRMVSGGGHKRGASMSNLMHSPKHHENHLPPLMKSVQLTVVTPFIHPAATSMGIMASPTGSTASSKSGSSPKISLMRRSQSRDSEQTDKAKQASPYVLKCLKPAVLSSPKVLDMGMKDMQIEIDMLQRLNHPHIISELAHGKMILDAIPMSPKSKQLSRKPGLASSPTLQTAYPFVILDRLGETLESKLECWEAKHQKHSSLVGKLVTHRNHKKFSFAAMERWRVLRDMASALEYMHEKRIIYRDVKPENVAFDRYSDQLKLIDLGLAKDLKPLTPIKATGLYRLTALTGSARYMAPEVAREDDYNELCDVYGMAIVIWQVLALQTPYAKFNVQKMFQIVYDCPHVRPSLEEWKEEDEDGTGTSQRWLVRLLNKMWSPLIEERPSMKEVHAILKRQVQKLEMEESAATITS